MNSEVILKVFMRVFLNAIFCLLLNYFLALDKSLCDCIVPYTAFTRQVFGGASSHGAGCLKKILTAKLSV